MKTLLIYLTFSLAAMMTLSAAPRDDGDEQSKLKKSVDITSEKSIFAKVKVNNGLVYLNQANSSQAFAGEFLFTERPPLVSYEVVGDEGRLSVKFTKKSGKNRDGDDDDGISVDWDDRYSNECYLNFTDQLPLDLQMDLGFIKGELDFGGLRLENCEIKTAVSEAQIQFSKPNLIPLRNLEIENGVGDLSVEGICNANFDELEFDAGAGSYELSFDGKLQRDAEVDIEIGVGKLEIYLPRNVGVRVRVEKSFLSSFDIDEIYKSDDDEYYNEHWNTGKPSLDIYLECGVATVSVYWLD